MKCETDPTPQIRPELQEEAITVGESWLSKQNASHEAWLKDLVNRMIEGSKRMETDPEYRRYIQSMTH